MKRREREKREKCPSVMKRETALHWGAKRPMFSRRLRNAFD
jgi:hypothetical protein